MKDALGHGSDARGVSHQASTLQKVGRTFGAMMRDTSGAGKMPHAAEHALDKLHRDPSASVHLLAEMGHPELATLAHMAHLFL